MAWISYRYSPVHYLCRAVILSLHCRDREEFGEDLHMVLLVGAAYVVDYLLVIILLDRSLMQGESKL